MYRYSPPAHPPSLHHPGYTSPYPAAGLYTADMAAAVYSQLNIAVGLKSVAQLSLSARISGFQGMTEVYNLVGIDK